MNGIAVNIGPCVNCVFMYEECVFLIFPIFVDLFWIEISKTVIFQNSGVSVPFRKKFIQITHLEPKLQAFKFVYFSIVEIGLKMQRPLKYIRLSIFENKLIQINWQRKLFSRVITLVLVWLQTYQGVWYEL